MSKELLLYIAFKTCGGQDISFGKHSLQYQNAIRLIAVNVFLHLLELFIIFFKQSILTNGKITATTYVVLIFFGA
jgi:hypothetical protein